MDFTRRMELPFPVERHSLVFLSDSMSLRDVDAVMLAVGMTNRLRFHGHAPKTLVIMEMTAEIPAIRRIPRRRVWTHILPLRNEADAIDLNALGLGERML